MTNKKLLLRLLLIIISISTIAAITSLLRTKVKKEYISERGYRVLIPLSWHHAEQEPRFCDGDEFSDYKSPTFLNIDSYLGFSVNICTYRNTNTQQHLQKLNAYGDEKTPMFTISGLSPLWYAGEGLIGELNTILVENRGSVYRISFWLPSHDRDYYEREKKKATDFLNSFEFIK